MAKGAKTNKPMSAEQGVSGFKKSGGYVYEEFLSDLRGLRGRRKYREMADTDPTMGHYTFRKRRDRTIFRMA